MTGNQPPPVPLVKGPGKARLFLTFSFFISLLVILAVGVGRYYLIPKATQQAGLSRNEIPKEPTTDWFYDEIGAGAALKEQKATAAAESYTLEIKLTKSKDEAEQLIHRLAKRGVQAYYTPVYRSGDVFYRVRRGLFSNKSEASQAAESLRHAKNVSARVVVMQ